MTSYKDINKLKELDTKEIVNRPAISVFPDNMSLKAILGGPYVLPRYRMLKSGKNNYGINFLIKSFKNERIVFVSEGGTGKTTVFLKLYTGIGVDSKYKSDTRFYYLFAPNLIKGGLNKYQQMLRNIVYKNKKLDGILLLDGLEEAYANDIAQANKLLDLLHAGQITFWVSCRKSFYEKLDINTYRYFSERIELREWEDRNFEQFLDKCLKGNDEATIIKDRISKIKGNSSSLFCRPLFATMILFLAQNNNFATITNEYDLIKAFLNKWVEREQKEKNTEMPFSYESIREIALKLYLNPDAQIDFDEHLSVFRDLFVLTENKIQNFYHREFLVFFIVDAMIDAALNHPQNIIKWFTQTFYDDISTMLRPVLDHMSSENCSRIYDNLFRWFKMSYEERSTVEAIFESMELTQIDKSFLMLRDEVLYFIYRLPIDNFEEFTEYALERIKEDHYFEKRDSVLNDYLLLKSGNLHKSEKRKIEIINEYNKMNSDAMLFLGIAYGMAMHDPNNQYTFAFAKRLYPGTFEELRNRGWGMCFFGDILNDGYIYIDNENKSWEKIRNNRFKRLADDKHRYFSRVLDIPLLYCYYASREFEDCKTIEDYKKIEKCNVSLRYFNKQQNAFMKEQKENLLYSYQLHIFEKNINYMRDLLHQIERKDIHMEECTSKVLLEIDKETADYLLCKIEQKEKISNNLRSFYDLNWENKLSLYKPLLDCPGDEKIEEEEFNMALKKVRIILISANKIEGSIITRNLINTSNVEKLKAFIKDGQRYQLATINDIPVLHIWPNSISSFTEFGSYDALKKILDDVEPRCVISLGVAFGIDPDTQMLGQVLMSERLLFYDNYNKVTDGKIIYKSTDICNIDETLLAEPIEIKNNNPHHSIGIEKWKLGDMLSGGTVLSDIGEKGRILEAAQNIGFNPIGGEMEACGIYYACQKSGGKTVPFMVVKGICDWGAEKNSWNLLGNTTEDSETIKNCVQAYACENAFKVVKFIISRLSL